MIEPNANPLIILKTQLIQGILGIQDKKLRQLVMSLYDSVSSDLDECNYIMSAETEDLYDEFLEWLTPEDTFFEDEDNEDEMGKDFEFEEEENSG